MFSLIQLCPCMRLLTELTQPHMNISALGSLRDGFHIRFYVESAGNCSAIFSCSMFICILGVKSV